MTSADEPLEDGPQIPPALRVSGDFVTRVTIIPTSTSSILLGLGTLVEEGQEESADSKEVLVPYIETKVAGIRQDKMDEERLENEEFEELMSAILPLDNALFFTWDVVRDIHVSCAKISNMSRGSLALEPVRLANARHFALQLRDQAQQCADVLQLLIDGCGKE